MRNWQVKRSFFIAIPFYVVSFFVLLRILETLQIPGIQASWHWAVLLYAICVGTVSVHELGHAFAIKSIKGHVKGFTFYAGGASTMGVYPKTPLRQIWVSFAGPLGSGFAGVVLVALAYGTGVNILYFSAFVAFLDFTVNLLPITQNADGSKLINSMVVLIKEQSVSAVKHVAKLRVKALKKSPDAALARKV